MALRNISLNAKLVFIVIIFFSVPQFMKSDTKVNYHVLNYTDLVPVHYDVKIELDFHRNVLFGECNITINIIRQMINMSVPSINFGIFQINMINEKDNQIINVPIYSFINETQLYIDFAYSSVNVLVPGTYILQMTYFRNILDDENFLGSLYKKQEAIKVLAETGVEVIRAQQIFPCWNEPAFETTFTISIKHNKKYTVLSNMFIKRKEYEDESNTMWTHFDKSPSMPIQHLTIVITTFQNIHSFIPAHYDNLFGNVTIWCKCSMKLYILARDILFRIVSLLKENNEPTKIPKIDYVAFWDTQHSNIETFGLILHRQKDIIYDETFDSIARKIEVANFLARQVLSIWFHDLMWPIQGFATYFAAYILEKIEYLNYIKHLFVVQIQQESFRFDIPSNTNLTLHNSNLHVEVNNTFPYYFKSSVLWCVLRNFLNDEMFWYVIRVYVLRHKQSSEAKVENLWIYVQNTIDDTRKFPQFNITKYIDIWMKKNYYPVLYVAQNYTTNTLLFSYLSSGYIDKDVEQLPALVTYTIYMAKIGDKYEKYFWLSPQQTKTFKDYDKNNVIIVNVEQKGYYRVHYDYENWRKIAQYLNSNHFSVHVLNQAQIVDDAFYFLIHRQLSVIMFWNLVSFLSENTNYVAWYPMFKAFEYMACIFSFDNVYLTQNMEKILNGVLQEIGYNEKGDEEDLIKCLREEAAKWACILGVRECRTAATLQLIEDLERSAQDNHVTWKEEWKYCKGLMSANNSVWDSTLHKYENNSNNRILEYLTCSKDPFVINIYLNHTSKQNENTSYIKEQNKRVNIVLLTVAKHVRQNIVLDFILKRLESKQLQFTGNWQSDTIAILIVTITHISSVIQLQKVSIFATNYLEERRLINAVKTKIRQRKSEYGKKIANYGTLLQDMRK